MIRYAMTHAELAKAIGKDWLARAAARTATFRRLGRYEEKSSIWSEVKPVYMRLQGEKCAYCERRLESVELGRVEQDVEHYRPKGNVRVWKPSAALRELKIRLTPLPRKKGGYYLLPYHIFNYAAACKPCNSAMKGDRFPVSGAYRLNGADPARMKEEKPYLIYPLGTIDDDPEKLIAFHGVSPYAVARRGHRRNRALVTIEFFHLDDDQRKNLLRERALVIIGLYPQLVKAIEGSTAQERKRAAKVVAGYMSGRAPHTNCARSLERLFKRSRTDAEAIFQKAEDYIVSIS
jgi:hypothetical protein